MTGPAAIAFFILATAFAFIGAASLALSQDRHWRAVAPKGSRAPGFLRPAGWCFTFACLVACIARDGGSFAALIWPILMAAACLVVAMSLAYFPAPLMRVATTLAGAVTPETTDARR